VIGQDSTVGGNITSSTRAAPPQPTLSVVIPSYNEEANLPVFYERLCAALDAELTDWEMIVVDDHSLDRTFEVAASIRQRDPRVLAIRLARNAGTHIAAMCGLEYSRGNSATVLAADMQDPPEVILQLLQRWKAGDQIVWAVRSSYERRTKIDALMSRIFHKLMARIIGDVPFGSDGADFFLIDRVVVDALTQYRERNLSLFAIVAWLGFRQGNVKYAKEARRRGKSGWTLRKKLKLFVDSITAFSFVPIRAMSLIGILVALFGFLYAVEVFINYFFGVPVEGWTSLAIIVLVLGGMQITMLGILGEYLWRSLDEARRRPRYDVENTVGISLGQPAPFDDH
jgi:polyisoprenyl-phosphate glycosyltransferase